MSKASNLLSVEVVVLDEVVVELVGGKPFLVSFWLFSTLTIPNSASSLASVGSVVVVEEEVAEATVVEQVPGAVLDGDSETFFKSVMGVVSVVERIPGTVVDEDSKTFFSETFPDSVVGDTV